jgi:serine phosphatase RsbU (regulator of sigma subunit)
MPDTQPIARREPSESDPGAASRRVLRHALVLGIAAAGAFGVFLADFATGAEISLSFLYLLPIVVATWFFGRRMGLLFAGLSAAGWLAAYQLNGRFYSQPRILDWNLAVESATFCAAALSVAQLRVGIERERGLARRLEEAFRLLDREQQEVGRLQRSLLPAQPPEVPGYSFSVRYATSTRAGGDYYDFFPLARDRIGLVVADASGHGSPAAVVMAVMHALLHTAPETLESPEGALAALNARLIGNMPAGSFATACYAALDPGTGGIEYALGGHLPALLVRGADGRVDELGSPDGLPLGISPDARFSRRCARLATGDSLLFYTDGLIEAMNDDGEFFGEEGVRRLLVAGRLAGPEAICDGLVEALRAHTGALPPADDVTLVLIRAH